MSEEIKVKGKHLKEAPAEENTMETPVQNTENQDTENQDTENIEETAPKSRKGVATSVVALLVVLALICGAVPGYLAGSNFSATARRLTEAEALIAEYETLFAEMYTAEFEETAQTGEEGFAETAPAADDSDIAALSGNDIPVEIPAEPVVVAEFNGGTVMSDEAMEAYETALAEYVMLGQDVTDYSSVIMNTVLESLVAEKIAYQKATELGYTTLTDADRAKIAELAEAEYSDIVAFYMDMVWEEGMNEEEAFAAAAEYLESTEGYTVDTVASAIEEGYWFEKLCESITSQVKVTNEEITATYNDLLAQQTADFEENHANFETALMNGEMIVYYPQGYRAVKHILIALDEEDQAQVDALNAQLETETDEEAIAAINESLDSIYASYEERADDVLAKYNGGEDFDALMSDYSADDELINGYFADTGYFVAEDSTMWHKDFVSAAMALALPGDVSAPVRTPSGVHLIRYISNVDSGAVLLSEVSAKMTADTQAAAEENAILEQMEIWTTEAAPVYHPENMGL